MFAYSYFYIYPPSIPQTTLFLPVVFEYEKRGGGKERRRSTNLREQSSHLEENCLQV